MEFHGNLANKTKSSFYEAESLDKIENKQIARAREVFIAAIPRVINKLSRLGATERSFAAKDLPAQGKRPCNQGSYRCYKAP